MRLGARTVEIANNRGHTSLVAHSGGQVNGLLGVVLGETREEIQLISKTVPSAQKTSSKSPPSSIGSGGDGDLRKALTT